MKLTIRFTAIILLTVLATACDPGYNEDMLIRNASSHSVTVIPAPYSWYDSGTDSTHTWTNESYTLVPGQEVVIHHSGGVGAASFEEGVQAFLQYYSNSVTFRFDGELGPQVVYYVGDTTGISPYNFSSTLYQYEETRHYGRWFNGHPSYGKLTFTITDEHYQATEGSNYLEVKN